MNYEHASSKRMPLSAFARLPAFKAFSPALTHLQRQALRSSLKGQVNVKARGLALTHLKNAVVTVVFSVLSIGCKKDTSAIGNSEIEIKSEEAGITLKDWGDSRPADLANRRSWILNKRPLGFVSTAFFSGFKRADGEVKTYVRVDVLASELDLPPSQLTLEINKKLIYPSAVKIGERLKNGSTYFEYKYYVLPIDVLSSSSMSIAFSSQSDTLFDGSDLKKFGEFISDLTSGKMPEFSYLKVIKLEKPDK